MAARAWTDKESKYVGLNTLICFRSTYVNNRKQKSNCVRLKSSISGVKQYEHIIFETKNTQFKFKTNNRSGTNIKFWLKERANEDTISIYSFLNQLDKAEIALVGAMCKKITEMKWLTATVRKAIDKSNDIDPYVINRFKSAGYQDINRIANRCQAAVQQKIGKIELVKTAASKTSKKRKECEYTKNQLYDRQSTLRYLGIYKSKVDGLIVVDLPYPENKPFALKCKKKGINFIQLVSPTTSSDRLKQIIKDSHDMIYYISMLSTTGGKLKVAPKKILERYNKIKSLNKNKNIVIGFGITEKTIKSLKKADGLVVGSAICKEITNSIKKRQNAVTNVTNIVRKLKNKIK